MEFPCKTSQYFCARYTDLAIEPHYHYETELLYCVDGDLIYRVEGRDITVHSGEVLIIPSGVIHERLLQKQKVSPRAIFIKLAASLFGRSYTRFSVLRFRSDCLSLTAPEVPEEIRSAFARLAELVEGKKDDESFSFTADWLIRSQLLLIACYLYSDFSVNNPGYCSEKKGGTLEQTIPQVIQYIEKNFNEAFLTLDSVSSAFGYEKTYFCKLFRETTGRSFLQYLNAYRCTVACGLLRNTASPIQTIAAECGFGSAKTFSQVFRKNLHCTPTQYRTRPDCPHESI